MISRLRLTSGFVLFIFVLGHFANYALGLVSLFLMNDSLSYTVDPWRTLPGTVQISELDFSDHNPNSVSIRGRVDEIEIYAINDASKLNL